MRRKKRIVVVEQNFIIGQHIIELLTEKGHEVYEYIANTESLEDVFQMFKPDIVIIHKNLFYRHHEALARKLKGYESIFFIVLSTLTPGTKAPQNDTGINFIEKPFLGYEIPELIS